MNMTKASCGHYVAAVGAPGSAMRREAESQPCRECRKPVCPECGSRNIGDEMDTMDGVYAPWCWWNCLNCGHEWRYQDETYNPGGKGGAS